MGVVVVRGDAVRSQIGETILRSVFTDRGRQGFGSDASLRRVISPARTKASNRLSTPRGEDLAVALS